MVFGFDWKLLCVCTNWFEAFVEVVIEKAVSLAQLIPLNFVSKKCTALFDWHIISLRIILWELPCPNPAWFK